MARSPQPQHFPPLSFVISRLCPRGLVHTCWVIFNSLQPYTGSSVHGTLQARIPEWVAIFSSKGFSWARDQTQSPLTSALTCRFSTPEPPLNWRPPQTFGNRSGDLGRSGSPFCWPHIPNIVKHGLHGRAPRPTWCLQLVFSALLPPTSPSQFPAKKPLKGWETLKLRLQQTVNQQVVHSPCTYLPRACLCQAITWFWDTSKLDSVPAHRSRQCGGKEMWVTNSCNTEGVSVRQGWPRALLKFCSPLPLCSFSSTHLYKKK